LDGNIDTVHVKYVVITHILKLYYRKCTCITFSKYMQNK